MGWWWRKRWRWWWELLVEGLLSWLKKKVLQKGERGGREGVRGGSR